MRMGLSYGREHMEGIIQIPIDSDIGVTFAACLRAILRQDPDVILVGEIRDRESIFAAMQAAETGHLVITTLHADSVPQAISRIREHYLEGEQRGIASLLGRNLNAIVCQRLLPNCETPLGSGRTTTRGACSPQSRNIRWACGDSPRGPARGARA